MKGTIIHPLLIATFLLACRKDKAAAPAEPPVIKDVTYRVFATKDYSEPIYAGIQVELRLQARIINYKTGEMTLVWDSTFSTRKLTDFPQEGNAVVIKKAFPVLDSHQKLNGSFSVRYKDGEYVTQQAGSDEAGPGKTNILMETHL